MMKTVWWVVTRLNGTRPLLGLVFTLLVADIPIFSFLSSSLLATYERHLIGSPLWPSRPHSPASALQSSPWPPPTSSPLCPPPPPCALLSASVLHSIHHISASTVLVLPFSLSSLRNSTAERSLTDLLMHVGFIAGRRPFPVVRAAETDAKNGACLSRPLRVLFCSFPLLSLTLLTRDWLVAQRRRTPRPRIRHPRRMAPVSTSCSVSRVLSKRAWVFPQSLTSVDWVYIALGSFGWVVWIILGIKYEFRATWFQISIW